MAKTNPANPAFNQFGRDYEALADKILIVVNRELAKGATPEKAAAIAIRVTKAEGVIEDSVVSAMVKAASIGAVGMDIDAKGLRKFYLDRHVNGVTISETIARADLAGVISHEIKVGLRLKRSWESVARRLTRADAIAGDVGQYMRDLTTAARRAFNHAGDVQGFAEYRAALRKAERNIGKLKTGRLAAAYENLAKKAESAAGAVLDKAIERAVRAKAAYNAGRIARTETARAYGEASFARINADPDIAGIRWELSSDHNVDDICDLNASLDAYGMGPGVYPKDHFPAYPAHPQCRCLVTDVWVAPDPGKFDRDAPRKALDAMPRRKRKALLGVAGERRYQRSKSAWSKELRNWNGHHDTRKEAIPKKFTDR